MTEQVTVTVGVIAKEFGVSDTKVKKAIEALKIEPAGKRGVCKLYATDVVDAVKNKPPDSPAAGPFSGPSLCHDRRSACVKAGNE